MEFGIQQNVFMVFFAIFWGATANVQPRWKAFQFPLMFTRGLRWNVLRRVCLALLLLNVLPILYFGYIFFCTSLPGRGPAQGDTPPMTILKILIHGILPAFGMFGIYRLWLAIIEICPHRFYKCKPADVPEKYRHVEPTYRLRYNDRPKDAKDDYDHAMPVVDLGEHAGIGNLIAALTYLLLGGISPWLL